MTDLPASLRFLDGAYGPIRDARASVLDCGFTLAMVPMRPFPHMVSACFALRKHAARLVARCTRSTRLGLIEERCHEQGLRYGLRRVIRAEVLSACESPYTACQRAVAAQSI